MALPSPFAASAASVSIVAGPDMSTAMAELGKQADLAQMSVMLIDMTKQPKGVAGFSHFAGANTGVTRYSASLVKIAAMFAAFRLRKNFREAALELPAKTADELRKQVTDAWKPIVQKSVGGDKDFPDLKKIFAITGSTGNWTIDFDDRYRKNMEEMIGPSDNYAASNCILPLGYQYIQGALAAEGFYSGSGGMWLAGDFAKGRDGIPEPKSKSHQAADAASVAKFLALLVTQSLVKDSASAVMRKMMNNCYMTRILTDKKLSYAPYSFGKLGRGPEGSFHDCAVIERTLDNGKVVRYVAVMLGAKGSDPLWRVGRFLDSIIAWVHK